MNAVVPTDQTRAPMLTGGRIAPIIPQSMEDAYRLGTAICKAGMAPRGMEQPEKCMIAIMRGLEVGLTPMQALDKIAVVNGRPTIWGDGAMALVRGSGLCEYVNERIDGEGDRRIAVCESKRRGETQAVTRSFSVDEAKEAGLWGKQGPWKQFPARMLQMRARAFTLRDLYADVLGGLYLREEIEEERRQRGDEPPAAPRHVNAEPAAPRQIEHSPSRATEQAGRSGAVEDAEAAGGDAPDPQASASAQDDGVVSLDSLLTDLDERLGYAKTADEVEEGYTDFDAEALLSAYEGGVEAARALKAKHLERVPAPAAQKSPEPVDHAASFPGNDAIKANEKKDQAVILADGKDPFALPDRFKGGGHYSIFVRDAVAAATKPEHAADLRRIWSDTKPIRTEFLGNGQLHEIDIKGEERGLQKLVTDKVRALETDSDDLPPPAPRQRSQQPQDGQNAPSGTSAASEPSIAASDDPVAAYTAQMEAAFAEAKTKLDVDRFWFATTDVRDEQTGASEEQRAKWRMARNKAKGALPDGEG